MEPCKKSGSRYNKVNQQKKFYLLTLIYKQHLPVREAAQIVGINYLTAKTIVFFYKNNHKTYQFDLDNTHAHPRGALTPTASVLALKKLNSIQEKLNYPKSRIEVICSIGNILSPPARACDREGPPEAEAADALAPPQTLPNALAPPQPAGKTALDQLNPPAPDSSHLRREGFEGKFSVGDGQADRTRVLY